MYCVGDTVRGEGGVDTLEPCLRRIGIVISEAHHAGEIEVGSAPAG